MEHRSITAETDFERRLISSLIMSSDLLKECYAAANPDLFSPGVCRSVATWVWDYFDRVGEAPKASIEDLYLSHAMDMSETDSQAARLFLSSLSANYQEPNLELMKKDATDFFKIRAATKLRDELDRAILLRDASLADSLVADYISPESVRRESVNLFGCEPQVIADAFNEEAETLFTFSGAAERVLGKFSREDFVAFAAPPKRGKSWWLFKIGTTATMNGWNVLVVSLEMKKTQVLRRLWQQVTGTSRWGEETINSRFEVGPTGRYVISSPKVPTTKVNVDLANIEDVQSSHRQYWKGRLEIRCWPTKSLTVPMLERELKDMAVYENFTPDVIVIDYADIMRPVNGRGDERDRINEIWSSLRGLAQERKALIVTATQTGRATVDGSRDANTADVAEDIRKVAHVTKMMVINQSPEEKKLGIYRLTNDTTRDEASAEDQLICTSCLAIGEPMMDCRLLSEVDLTEDSGDGEDEPSRERRPRTRRGFRF